jgi:hypothetical protein
LGGKSKLYIPLQRASEPTPKLDDRRQYSELDKRFMWILYNQMKSMSIGICNQWPLSTL